MQCLVYLLCMVPIATAVGFCRTASLGDDWLLCDQCKMQCHQTRAFLNPSILKQSDLSSMHSMCNSEAIMLDV